MAKTAARPKSGNCSSDIAQQGSLIDADQYRLLLARMVDGFALLEIKCDENDRPIDYEFIEVNPAFERFTGLSATDIVGKTIREVLPDIEESWIEAYGQVALTGDSITLDYHSELLRKHYRVTAYSPRDREFITVFHDISDLYESKGELIESEAVLKAIMETTADGILVVNGEGKVIYYNPQFLTLWNVHEEALKRMNDKEIFDYIVTQLTTGETTLVELQSPIPYRGQVSENLHLRDGRVVDCYSRPLLEQGKQTRQVWRFRDITARVRAQDELEESQANLAEAERIAHLGNWVWNIQKGTLTWSDEVYRIFGLEPESCPTTYEAFLSAVHPDDRDMVNSLVEEALQRREPYAVDHRVVRPSGETRIVHEQGEVDFSRDREAVKMVGTVQDITDRKHAEQRLIKYNAELEKRNELLQNFAFIASHDLKEPLRKVRTFGERLKMMLADSVGEKERSYLDRMQSAAQRMQDLIDGLLSYSRISTKGGDFLSVSLNEVLTDVLTDLELNIENAKAEINVAGLPTIQADPLQMRQLFQNLVANALKFRKKGEPARIRIGSSKVDYIDNASAFSGGDWCQLIVEDEGIGFDEKYLSRIFEIFQKVHGRSEYEGTGIGLAICRKIVERHGGNITARSALGKGSAFIINLPKRHHQGGENNELSI